LVGGGRGGSEEKGKGVSIRKWACTSPFPSFNAIIRLKILPVGREKEEKRKGGLEEGGEKRKKKKERGGEGRKKSPQSFFRGRATERKKPHRKKKRRGGRGKEGKKYSDLAPFSTPGTTGRGKGTRKRKKGKGWRMG